MLVQINPLPDFGTDKALCIYSVVGLYSRMTHWVRSINLDFVDFVDYGFLGFLGLHGFLSD